MQILETERLQLREFTTDDTAFILKLVNSPGWLQFIGDRNIHTEKQAESYLVDGPIKSYADNGFGLSMVALKDGTPIGMCGIVVRKTLDFPDIGFAFLPDYTRKGFAYEIASATLRYAMNDLNLKTIAAITDLENSSSIKLLEKIGMTFKDKITLSGAEVQLLLYTTS